jgi:hypothetical protein
MLSFGQMVREPMLDEYPRADSRPVSTAVTEDGPVVASPHDQANAVGNLVLHLAGSNQFYLGHAIGGGA